MNTRWDSSLYEANHSFVWQYGQDLLPMLNPQGGERILDVGCGTGQLTSKIAESGASTLGIDNSVDMIGQARMNYPKLEFRLADITKFETSEKFDAVFSNAALHWVTDAEAAVSSIAAALKPGGRFVAEFGGRGNIQKIVAALDNALKRRSLAVANTFFFPSPGEYAPLLEKYGLEVRSIELFDRVTDLDDPKDGIRNWIRMFKSKWVEIVPPIQREGFFQEVEAELAKTLHFNGIWHADYRRLRVIALNKT